jgi:hypothetical protein
MLFRLRDWDSKIRLANLFLSNPTGTLMGILNEYHDVRVHDSRINLTNEEKVNTWNTLVKKYMNKIRSNTVRLRIKCGLP